MRPLQLIQAHLVLLDFFFSSSLLFPTDELHDVYQDRSFFSKPLHCTPAQSISVLVHLILERERRLWRRRRRRVLVDPHEVLGDTKVVHHLKIQNYNYVLLKKIFGKHSHLRDAEQRSDDDHPAERALEEGGGTLVAQDLAEGVGDASVRLLRGALLQRLGKNRNELLPMQMARLQQFIFTCSLVFTTSAGLTNAAEIDPAMHPERKDHQKTDSVEPGVFFGPMAFRLAKRGK